MDRKTALILIMALAVIFLLAVSVCAHESPALKSKRRTPGPSVTIEPYRIPLPIMGAGEKITINYLTVPSS